MIADTAKVAVMILQQISIVRRKDWEQDGISISDQIYKNSQKGLSHPCTWVGSSTGGHHISQATAGPRFCPWERCDTSENRKKKKMMMKKKKKKKKKKKIGGEEVEGEGKEDEEGEGERQ